MNLLQRWNVVFLVGFMAFFYTLHVFIGRTREVPTARRQEA